jgi:sugar transferase (PEP-CTERM/EpsH1 system associated)
MSAVRDPRPLVAHVIHRFDVGGLENGLINLVNHLDLQSYRHAVIALTQITELKARIKRPDVQFIGLDKPAGHGIKVYPHLFRLMRQMRPAIVHTRNLAALEATAPAWAAGVPVRVHGEHGRDADDVDGASRKHQVVRRLYRPFVSHYITVSRDLNRYLERKIGVPPAHVSQIYNGVDAQRFKPAGERIPPNGCPFDDSGLWVIGTVGRMDTVKDQVTLARAFVRALEIEPAQRKRLRLIIVGDGQLRAQVQRILTDAGAGDLSWLPGQRKDIPDILRGLDCFVLPSLGEGISNTILEAMATGLPVIATDVGGNSELVESGRTGKLVPSGSADAMAQGILAYARDTTHARDVGRAGRARIERLFSLDTMVNAYRDVYDTQLESVFPELRRIGAA